MANESELQDDILYLLRDFIGENYPELSVGKEVSIMKDCTFVGEKGEFSLCMGHANADIAVYTKSEKLSNQINESENVKLYQNGDKEIKIPLVVIELKRGDSDETISTDDIRSRSIVAREENELFPRSKYLFVADNVANITPRKTIRSGKHFDYVFTAEGKKDRNELKELGFIEAVDNHLKRLKESSMID